jgi:membrane protease YdiL (CAAX protease family)
MTKRGSILMLAVISEVVLVLLAYIVAWSLSLHITWNLSLKALIIGAAAAAPLLVGNHLLWSWTERNPDSVYARFSREVVVPLCKRVSALDALLIGILSGIGEEVLFRGTLNLLLTRWGGLWLAIILTSVAFAWIHFIGTTRRYGGMIPLYTAVGAALWLVWYATDSLAAAAAMHATYNFLAIVWIRRLAERGAEQTA